MAGERALVAAVGELGLGELDQEPRRLQETIAAVAEEIKAISVARYEVHIEHARCVEAVGKGSRAVRSDAAGIGETLGQLAEDLKRFKRVGAKIAEAQNKNSQTLEKHVQLLELLEVPQLMDTCSRNNLFDEALDLSSFASTLQKRHLAIASLEPQRPEEDGEDDERALEHKVGGGTAIINAIAEEVYDSAAHMRKQLLQQLRQQINLPTCLRIISLLKRLDAQERVRKNAMERANVVHDEIHLRFEFLDCRDAYINSLATEDPGSYFSRPYQSSLKLIERCRVNWFDVITQYKAIFASGSGILQELEEDGGILARWVSSKMIDFLIVLERAIANLDDFGSLANVLEQAMKFGLSLARVGADFRPLLMEPFKRRVLDLMLDFWQQGMERAETRIAQGDWGTPLPIPKKAASGASPKKEEDGEHNEEQDVLFQDDALSPPLELLAFPLLAELTNLLLASFNELRQCASPVFGLELGRALVAQLERVSLALAKFEIQHDDDKDAGDGGAELQRFNQLCELFAQTLLPYTQRVFDAVFDRQSLSSDLKTFCPISDLQSQVMALRADIKQQEPPPNEETETLPHQEDYQQQQQQHEPTGYKSVG